MNTVNSCLAVCIINNINRINDILCVFWQGAVISGVTGSIHRDTRYWNNPEEFLPERWLDSDGKFVTKKEGFVPFGVGELAS